MKNFNETNISTMASQEFNAAVIDIAAEDIQGIIKASLLSIVKFLKIKRDKKNPVAIAVENKKKDFVLGAILSYTESEDEETKGSWNLSFTFDQDDLKDIETKYQNSNDEYDTFLRSELSYFAWSITAGVSHLDFIAVPLFTLHKYLEYAAKEDETVEVNLFDLAKISVSIEDGERVYSFEPSEVLRQYLKDDAN